MPRWAEVKSSKHIRTCYNFLILRATLLFMKSAKCYLCSSNNYRLIVKKSKYDIVRCNNCSFIFTTPYPDKNVTEKFYRSFDYKDSSSAEKVIRSDSKRSLEIIDQFIERKGELLDVGCGRGYFLDEARRLGWNTYGVDSSKLTIDFAKRVLRLNVFRSDIFSFQPEKSFDLISLNQVVEHFANPEILINQCGKHLKRGGLLYIATPNVESISARVLKDNFDHYIPPEHLGYFSRRTLKRLLEKLDFKVVYTGSWSYPSDLGGIIKTLLGKKTQLKESGRYFDNISCESEYSSNFFNVKHIKSFIFDKVFCRLFYKLLCFDSWGINLEMLAVKL